MFPSAKVTEDTKTDYLYWVVIHKGEIIEKISTMIDGIDYTVQFPPPYR